MRPGSASCWDSGPTGDEAQNKAAAVRAGGTAVERIDGTLAALHRARAALVTEIRQDQDEAAAREDAMLASRA